MHELQNASREAMENTLEHMRDSLKNDKKIHMEAYQRIQSQNVQLLRDINILRKMESNILIQRETFDQLRIKTEKMRQTALH